MEDSFSMAWGGGWFQNDSSILHLLYTLFPSLLHHPTSGQLVLDPRGCVLRRVLQPLQPRGLSSERHQAPIWASQVDGDLRPAKSRF